jgi:hypothetical protein
VPADARKYHSRRSTRRFDIRLSRRLPTALGTEEAGGVLTEAAIVVLRLGGLIVPTGGPWGWVFCGRRWLPGSVALAPPSEGKDGSGQQPEDSYPAGFFPGDEDDAEGKKSTAGSV